MEVEVNDVLRRALFDARLTEDDVAARLAVDPKTVRRWVEGRLPYPRHRGEIARILNVDQFDLWPELEALQVSKSKPAEIVAVYPQRSMISGDGWRSMFSAANREIDILAYAGLFLAENAGLIGLLQRKAEVGVRVRIALGDPDGLNVAQRGAEEEIGTALAAKIRNALVLYRPVLRQPAVELRLHDTVLYNSIYRADNQLLVNQHVFGVPAAQAPVYHLRETEGEEMFPSYMASFERIWSEAAAPPETS
jgi:hypothetical protein